MLISTPVTPSWRRYGWRGRTNVGTFRQQSATDDTSGMMLFTNLSKLKNNDFFLSALQSSTAAESCTHVACCGDRESDGLAVAIATKKAFRTSTT